MILLCSLPWLIVCLLSPESGFSRNFTVSLCWMLLVIRLAPVWQSSLCLLFCSSAQWFITKSMFRQHPQSAPHLLLITVPPVPLTASDFYDNNSLLLPAKHVSLSPPASLFLPSFWNHLCQTSFTQHYICEIYPVLFHSVIAVIFLCMTLWHSLDRFFSCFQFASNYKKHGHKQSHTCMHFWWVDG